MDLQLFAGVRALGFVIASALCLMFSWRALRSPGSHGFFRFFAFEGILLLLFANSPYWFHDRFSPFQLVSWALLFASLFFLVQGLYLLCERGGRSPREHEPGNFAFENTAHLVTDGIYRYIRHPLYSSLLLLAWGIFFKQISLSSFATVAVTSAFLLATAKAEERENIRFFGPSYRKYIANSKMFFHYLF